MKKFRSVFLLLASAFLVSGCSFLDETNTENQNQTNGNQQQEVEKPTLSKIVASDYTKEVFQYSEFTFDGKVTACYSDNSTKIVTGYDVSTLNTEILGNQPLTITYTENNQTVSSTINIQVISHGDGVLTKIEASNYTTSVKKNDTYVFDGVVKAFYSDDFSRFVRDYSVGSIDTSTVGQKDLKITYEEGTISVFTKIQINVYEPEVTPISVTGISLNFDSKELLVDETFTLIPIITPSNASNQDVEWSSNNNSVATVTNGVIRGVSQGTATITAKTVDGNKTATCFVTVKSGSSEYETITPEEAVNLIDSLEQNKVSSKEYYIRGVATNVDMDNNGFNGGFLNTNLKFRSVKGNGIASAPNELSGKEIVIFGYIENYNGIYQIPYLPAYASPTGAKYNAKLISIFSGEQEDVEVTHISLSPVTKTLGVGEKFALNPTILPENATNKSINWSSSDSSICSVNFNGEITGVSVGNAVITAKTANNLTAICEVTVTKDDIDPIIGDKFAINFNHFESDGQTELNSSTVLDQVTSGLNLINKVISLSKVFKGMEGLKIGSSTSGGSLKFETTSIISELNCKEIILDVSVSGIRTKTVNVYLNDSQVGSGSSGDGKINIRINDDCKVNTITVSTTGRVYLSGITLVCEEFVPIPVTGISIAPNKSISIGNSELLSVTYIPSNANTGKAITWTSNNTSIVTVSANGSITGVGAGNATITAESEGGFTSKCNVTVSNIAVISISLSSTSEVLKKGATKQLTYTILPTNATNKDVTWTSSDSTVASVSETGLVTALAAGTSVITVKTVDGNKTATCSITVEEVAADKWTILIYMCGADLESENSLASSDIKEILSVKNQPEDVNILIETGGSKSWHLGSSYIEGATKIDPNKLSRWHVENKKIVLDETLTYASMGSSSTLQSFVEYGITEYPAEKTGVILWNHGGAMYGCCCDEKKGGDSLLNSEMKQAFSSALKNTNTDKLEFVGYDTCLTQVQDIAEFNSHYFNYMIASEESESGYGWDYDTWIDDVYSDKSTETILKAIVDGFIKDNGGQTSYYSDQTLSYLDLSKMEDYKTAFESFASALNTQLSNKNVSKSTFASWMDKNVKAFAVDAESSEAYFCLFDVKDMLNKISNNSTYNPGATYLNAVNSAFSNLVKYSVAQKGAGNAYGLGCIYSQTSSYSYYLKQVYDSYETNFSNWLSFLKTYSYLG